jgi:hypothetical protein
MAAAVLHDERIDQRAQRGSNLARFRPLRFLQKLAVDQLVVVPIRHTEQIFRVATMAGMAFSGTIRPSSELPAGKTVLRIETA